jgi:hypothetical protein
VNSLVFGEDAVVFVQNDSIVLYENDSILHDSTTFVLNDSTEIVENSHLAPRSNSAIDSRIDFKATDSIFFDLRVNTVHLFEKAQVNYGQIELTAAKIEVHFDKDELSAFPKFDSLGLEIDRPFFKDDKQTFEARELTYNLVTGKARVKNIITIEGDMIIHGDLVKKLPNNESFVQRARFTTCDLEHPHFHIVARRAKVIPNDKIVTGGAMIFLNDVPTPLALPFGLFPNSSEKNSGILVPSYGESHNQNQGFFLRGGGFYWAISDNMDWRIEGDIYSRGEWELRNQVQYMKLYKYTGSLSFGTGMVPSGERGVFSGPSEFVMTRSTRVGWNHSQDQRANENSTFSASVNFFNQASQRYSSDISAHLNNQSNSNISYQYRGKGFQISSTANMGYNMSSGDINLTLPTIVFSMSRPFFPLKPKIQQGSPKWYQSLNIRYSMNASNQARGNDSSFWNQDMLKAMQNGVKHNVPIAMDIKLFGGKITWGHSVPYEQQWHFKSTRRGTVYADKFNKETGEIIGIDTIYGALLDPEHDFFMTQSYRYTTSFGTTLFGMAQFKRGPVKAVRHKVTPSVGFTISPDFDTRANGWEFFENARGEMVPYNIFQNSPAGFPKGEKRGSINFGLGNNLEMKVRDKRDTVRGERKISIFDQLNLGTSYNLMADSLNWTPISLTANITLFGKFRINYSAAFDMYARDTTGGGKKRINKFIWQTDDKILLTENQSMRTSFSWSFSSKNHSDNSEHPQSFGRGPIFEQSAAFAPQWSLNIGYTVGYNSRYDPGFRRTNIWGHPIDPPFERTDYHHNILQTLSLNGTLNLTEKWNISFNSGWDFREKKLSTTTFNIARDLHCWNMSFSWTPFGQLKQWSFNIQLVSNMLKDVMKYDRQRTHREMYQ